jgi:hypothetical protein
MKNQPGLKEKLGYQFDNIMSKGTAALVMLLFLITAVVVIVTGILGSLLMRDLPTGVGIWQSLMHALDAGTLAGDDPGNAGFLILMSSVTLCGIFVTSILIGIISTGFEQKLNALRKGTAKVIESGHTVIIGFNDGIYTLLSELIEAGANQKKNCIVVVGEQEKESMEELIKGHIRNLKSTRIIVKSGKQTEDFLLSRVSVETSKSIIVNQEDDFSVIKTILAVVNHLKAHGACDGGPHITAMIRDQENLDAAKIAGEGKAEVLYFKDALSRIIAHTCRQPGLSIALTEFFDFGGDEFYFEHFPELAGKTFGETLNLFERSTVVGLEHDGQVMLNPPMHTLLSPEDRIVHLAKDDNASKPQKQPPAFDLSVEAAQGHPDAANNHLLILGVNHFLPDILKELDNYADRGTVISVAAPQIPPAFIQGWFENITVNGVECDIYHKASLEALVGNVEKDARNILLLSDMECLSEESDSKTLVLLIHLRDIGWRLGRDFNLTSEMRSVDNQKLAMVANVNDFVVGNTITNLMMAQVSENRLLARLFEDLLDADGSELYMKRACRFVKPGVETDFYAMTEIAKRRGEIAVGYKKVAPEGIVIKTNPAKSDRIVFDDDDFLIVIAQDNH